MGNFHSNTGKFEPPGSRAVESFVYEYDKIAAELRAEIKKVSVNLLAEVQPETSPSLTCSMCSICTSDVRITVDPWQRTREDLLGPEIIADDCDTETSADGDTDVDIFAVKRRNNHGIKLKPCQHVFCGACLAGSIYRNLNIPFKPSTYGTVLAPSPIGTLGGKLEFPMGCPSCTVKWGENIIEIGDTTARLVLGPENMEEWNQARFMWTQDVMYLLTGERKRSREL